MASYSWARRLHITARLGRGRALSAFIAVWILSRLLSLRIPDFGALATGTLRIRRSCSNDTTYISSMSPTISWVSIAVMRPTPWDG